jgi:hypothetical protein
VFGKTQMDKLRCFATDSPAAFEHERLGFLSDMADPITARRLTRLGIERGWYCLEAVAGGMAHWIAETVGRQGRVVATHLDTRFLDGHERPNLEVRRRISWRMTWRRPATTSSIAA